MIEITILYKYNEQKIYISILIGLIKIKGLLFILKKKKNGETGWVDDL